MKTACQELESARMVTGNEMKTVPSELSKKKKLLAFVLDTCNTPEKTEEGLLWQVCFWLEESLTVALL